MDDKEPAVQNQGQNSPGRRTHLARGNETGQHQIQSVGLTDLGKDLDSLLAPQGAIGELQAGRNLDLHLKQSLYLEDGPQWVGVEARSPGRRPCRH